MSVFKCKMCGGSLEVTEGQSVCTCEYCGTEQTLPRLDSERKTNLYDRANHFRRNNDFDKAMSIYDQILNEDNTDAEAYWSIVLCRYGIEYVEDAITHKRIPTVNRAQHTSIFADEDYKEAINHATASQKVIFEEEAKVIDNIQKGILEISQKEEPFDVFICYKETDSSGARTRDSVIANDIYHQLTREGLKVFFAAITLENKLGQAYEPYIFAALNSAKVMIVLGTKQEYFSAPWVKNEWSRFLHIIKNNPEKILIPAYRDMDAYDLPEEFSFLQAQDMSKIGFMNDLIYGIKKVVNAGKEEKTERIATNSPDNDVYNKVTAESGVEQALKRADFFMEDGDWNSASVYLEKALDLVPECALAYVGKLMIEYGLKKRSELGSQTKPFTKNELFLRAVKYADDDLRKELQGYDYEVNNSIFLKLKEEFDNANSEKEFDELSRRAHVIEYFDGVKEFIEECLTQKDICHKEMIYSSAFSIFERAETIDDYGKCISILKEIQGYRDSDDIVAKCKSRLDELSVYDGKCVICREKEGTRTFIPEDSNTKCCEKCLSCLNLLYKSKGRASMPCKAAIEFLNGRMPYIAILSAKDRVRSIVEMYINSLPKDQQQEYLGNEELENSTREKTQYELEEERKKKEEEQKRKEEQRRAEIERRKQTVIDKNAAYEYDVQTVIDKATGGTDSDMLRYVLSKNAMNGWKLHSIVSDKVSDGAPIGQSVLIFERRIKEEGK